MASGILGQTALSATTWATVYTVPSAKVASCSVSVCNRNSAIAKVRLAIGTGTSGANGEFFEYDLPLTSAGTQGNAYEKSGLVLDAGKKILAYSDSADVDVTVTGFEQ